MKVWMTLGTLLPLAALAQTAPTDSATPAPELMQPVVTDTAPAAAPAPVRTDNKGKGSIDSPNKGKGKRADVAKEARDLLKAEHKGRRDDQKMADLNLNRGKKEDAARVASDNAKKGKRSHGGGDNSGKGSSGGGQSNGH